MKQPEPFKNIRIEDYQYLLPDERVAKYPLEQRDQSKLLVLKQGQISDRHFYQLHHELPANSTLIFNNTKVIRARLFFHKETGAKIEIFILDPVEPSDYALNFQQTERCRWKCIVGNLKKWKDESLQLQVNIKGKTILLKAENIAEAGNGRIIEFSWNQGEFTFSEILEAAGNIPIPPYLHRESEAIDLERYQTIYSSIKGSVAAPTAGLHFTGNVLKSLASKGIDTAELTLHVGAGTFQPVKSETIGEHAMHTEHFAITRSFLENLAKQQGPLIAVGTTSVRTLESLYQMAVKIGREPEISPEKLNISQWEAYELDEKISRSMAIDRLIAYLDRKGYEQINAATQIIIVPGYHFGMIDAMITNFHQPASTLLLLIAAFIGDDWKNVYQHALDKTYRFLSYGDSNLYFAPKQI
ncbi:MAG: S-adenosylmethionine:tRNA ribosyltransferase-isomerase [Prolixibacteraceae bacterium]|nr:S-adenosylmethionine:tRNA ribosyltransferase-isomerase [Prolixibacteraceae bacterium]